MILPGDVFYDILLRLPAKSVFNCKYVCKTWFSLISDPSFVKQHLDRTIHTKESKFMFVIQDNPDDQYNFLASTVSYEDTQYSSSFISSSNNWVAMDFPDDAEPIKLLGSCNGLICIMFETSVGQADGSVQEPFLAIWNPTTKEYKTLPNSQKYNDIQYVYSFGYDHKDDDYKILKFDAFVTSSLKLPDCQQVAEVYSLQSDSWTSIETITDDHILKYIPFGSVSAGVLVNGIYHWLAERKIGNEQLPEFILSYFEDFIVSFDFCEEKFKKMHLPKAFQDISAYYRPVCTVGVLEECLCAVSYSYYELEIWVMQDYGVEESWTKRFVIGEEDVARQLRDLTVTWCFKDDNILFHDKVVFKKRESHDQMLFLYDPKLDTGTTIKILPSSPAVILGAQNYIESLVSLNSGTYAGSYADAQRFHYYKDLVGILGIGLMDLRFGMRFIFLNLKQIWKRFGQLVLCWLNSGDDGAGWW